jgi:hypothetical protein
MKVWLNFIVLVAVASFCQAVPLRDDIDHEENQEMRGRESIQLDLSNSIIWLTVHLI